MGTVKVFDKEMKRGVSVFLFKDGEVFNAYCPELDLVGCDYTAEGTKESFGVVLSDYLKYTLEKSTLERELLKHGWNKRKSGKVTKPTASTLLRSRRFQSVLGRNEFSKYSVPVEL